MATVLVTGGAGYIGAHACKALAAAGHLPVTYDDLSKGHARAVLWGPLEEGDIADTARLDAAFVRHRPAAVMHFAAASEVGESVADPLKYYRINVAGSERLVARALAHGVRAIVFSSTCAVYGLPERVPMDEALSRRPINPYGRSKLAVEMMLEDAAGAYGLDVAALRYFNAAGASADAEIGEDHDPETHVVPLVLAAARDQSRSIGVFGTDYPTRDGSCIRDFVHVEDLATAHVAALERLLAGTLRGFTGINLGAGRGASVLELVAAAEAVTGRRIRRELLPRRSGDPAELVADPTRARDVLGWEARRSDLATILSSAWNWMNRRDDATRLRAAGG
jgi:UDP-arabinose 4-epimerase